MPLTALIPAQIAPQNFELIRDQIGGILLVEFLHQYTLNNNQDITPTSVDIERFVQIGEEDFPIVNVSFVNGKYSNKDYGGEVTGEYSYYIDFYTGAASTPTEGGDHIATLNLHKMLGMARAILEDTRYKTLAFDPRTSGLQIQRVGVESIYVNDPRVTENAIDFICGRLKFIVTVPETVPVVQPVPLGSVSARVDLFESDDYFFWFSGSGVVDIPQNVTTMYRQIELFIKDNPDPAKLIAVGNGQFIQQEYAPGPTLTPMKIGDTVGYLAGKLLYRPAILNNKNVSLLDFDVPTGVWDRTAQGGFNDNTSTGGDPDCIIINFRDYE